MEVLIMTDRMMKKSFLNILVIASINLTFLLASDCLPQTQEDEVIATLNGEPIYRYEIEQDIAFQIYRLRGNIYTLLKRETEERVNQKLLAAEAERRRISVDDLLYKEVDQKVSHPDDKELDTFFAENPGEAGNGSKSRDQIRTFLYQKSLSQQRQNFLASLKEKVDYKFLLEMPERPRMKMVVEGEPWRGNPDAPITLVHFVSFTCRIGYKSARMIEMAMEEYPDKIRWVHRNFFNTFDEKALTAAQYGEYAKEKGKFWEFHDMLLSANGDFESEEIFKIAESLDLDKHSYDNGNKEGRFLLAVKDDIRDATRLGITATPVIFVNGRYFHGSFSYEQLETLIKEEILRTQKR
jgi:hypothetical protein